MFIVQYFFVTCTGGGRSVSVQYEVAKKLELPKLHGSHYSYLLQLSFRHQCPEKLPPCFSILLLYYLLQMTTHFLSSIWFFFCSKQGTLPIFLSLINIFLKDTPFTQTKSAIFKLKNPIKIGPFWSQCKEQLFVYLFLLVSRITLLLPIIWWVLALDIKSVVVALANQELWVK